MTCSICNHPKRAEIEKACLLRNFGDTEVTLKDIAKEFGVDHRDLQVHVLMHQALEDQNESDAEKVTSIADKIKMREAEILHQVMEESFTTFKNLSAKINRIVSVHTIENPTMQQITKSMTDLYLGTSQSIRDTADKLCKMNLMLNGEDDKGLQQVAALVEAIHGS
jgi:hypothetical protein